MSKGLCGEAGHAQGATDLIASPRPAPAVCVADHAVARRRPRRDPLHLHSLRPPQPYHEVAVPAEQHVFNCSPTPTAGMRARQSATSCFRAHVRWFKKDSGIGRPHSSSACGSEPA